MPRADILVPRLAVLALVALALLGGCATETYQGGQPPVYRYGAPSAPEASRERRAPGAEQGQVGQGGVVFARLSTDFAPVRVGEAEFTAAMSTLLLDMPLRVASSSSARLQPGGRLAPGSGGPALEGVAAQLRATFDPNQMLATVTLGITAYMALWLAPDPVVTKSVALASTMLMWGYLGSELFEVTRAYVRLSEESARATTFAELREAGERFGRVIGPNSVRILVMLTTAAVGETAELMARAPKLPGFGQVSRTVESRQSLRLVDAATGGERLIVSSAEGTLRAVVPMTAWAMAAPGGGSGSSASGGGGTPKAGKLLPNGHRAFKSFDDFKDFMGPAGDGNQWHHIVEQRKVNVDHFGPEAIHNTENVIAVGKGKHDAISAYYSSKSRDTGDMVVREWLRTKSYEEQRAFGLSVLRQFGVLP